MNADYMLISSLLSVFAGAIAVFLLLGLVFYILYSIGLYQMAKNAGIRNPWLAWIPFGSSYIMGLLAERAYFTFTGKQMAMAKILLFGGIAAAAGSGIVAAAGGLFATIISLGSLALTVFGFYCLYYLYRDYAPSSEVVYLILSVIFTSLAQSILFMIIRNNIPVSVTGFSQARQPKYGESILRDYHGGQRGYQQPYNDPQPPRSNQDHNGPEL